MTDFFSELHENKKQYTREKFGKDNIFNEENEYDFADSSETVLVKRLPEHCKEENWLFPNYGRYDYER